jgi:hypothetical protein
MKVAIAAATALAALAIAGSASATSISLAFDPSIAGPYNQIDDSTYYVPRSSNAGLVAVVLDDNGTPGNTCFSAVARTLVSPEFQPEGGVSCPSDDGDGGKWFWNVHATETSQYKVINRPDGSNGAAESNVITLLTAPEVSWEMGYRRNTQVLSLIVQGDSDLYDGKLEVRQGGRLVASKQVTGTSASLDVKVAARTKARVLRAKGAFSVTLTPSDRSRWVTMTAKGSATRGKHGYAGPVL